MAPIYFDILPTLLLKSFLFCGNGTHANFNQFMRSLFKQTDTKCLFRHTDNNSQITIQLAKYCLQSISNNSNNCVLAFIVIWIYGTNICVCIAHIFFSSFQLFITRFQTFKGICLLVGHTTMD